MEMYHSQVDEFQKTILKMETEMKEASDSLQRRVETVVEGYKELNHLASLAPLGIRNMTFNKMNEEYTNMMDSINDIPMDPILETRHKIHDFLKFS